MFLKLCKALKSSNNFQKSEITLEVGGWVQVSQKKNTWRKIVPWVYMCILFVHIKFIKRYESLRFEYSVQIIDGFPKIRLDGVGVWDELYPVFFGIFRICLTLQNP